MIDFSKWSITAGGQFCLRFLLKLDNEVKKIKGSNREVRGTENRWNAFQLDATFQHYPRKRSMMEQKFYMTYIFCRIFAPVASRLEPNV